MNDELIRFSKEYINDVNNVCQMMLEVYNLSSREELLVNHRVRQGKGEFYLNGKKHDYAFHGRGCRFSNDELKIDWDFGYGDIWCGIDPWKLAKYIRDNKNDNRWNDGNKIKEVFDDLVSKGKMEKKYYRYYLR